MIAAFASMVILAVAICLGVDLLFAWLERQPTPGRVVVCAAALILLLTVRIAERVWAGTL